LEERLQLVDVEPTLRRHSRAQLDARAPEARANTAFRHRPELDLFVAGEFAVSPGPMKRLAHAMQEWS
jgi:hypothetical protein